MRRPRRASSIQRHRRHRQRAAAAAARVAPAQQTTSIAALLKYSTTVNKRGPRRPKFTIFVLQEGEVRCLAAMAPGEKLKNWFLLRFDSFQCEHWCVYHFVRAYKPTALAAREVEVRKNAVCCYYYCCCFVCVCVCVLQNDVVQTRLFICKTGASRVLRPMP